MPDERSTRDPSLPLTAKILQRLKYDGFASMASGISHDLNNHLAAIQGNNAAVMRSLSENDPKRTYTQRIDETSGLALTLADKLAVYSGRFIMQPEALDLAALLKESLRGVMCHAPDDIRITIEIDEHVPPLTADAARLGQAVRHLVLNALEAMVDQAGRLRVSAGPESALAAPLPLFFDFPRAPGDHIFIDVTDSGRGIAPTVMGRVCDPFFSTKIRGAGLGLPVAVGVVHAHGGNLCVDSRPGATTVRMLLPLVPPDL